MKFGGSSLATKEKRKQAIEIIKQQENEKKIVIVSAMGRYPDAYATETLSTLIDTNITFEETSRVLSIGEIVSSVVLSSELKGEMVNAISLSSLQAGLTVKDNHITNLDVEFINETFKKYDVIIIPGFQGLDEYNNIQILESGDSDYSAVYVARKLGCKEVYIYSDVCGIYTADPKIVVDAKHIPHIGYDQALELAKYKARIICYKALEEGCKDDEFKIYLKSTFMDHCSTVIDHTKSHIKTMSIDYDYDLISFDEQIKSIDNDVIYEKIGENYIIKKSNINSLQTEYTKIDSCAKIHFVGLPLENDDIYYNDFSKFCLRSSIEKDSYYVSNKNLHEDIHVLHNVLIKED